MQHLLLKSNNRRQAVNVKVGVIDVFGDESDCLTCYQVTIRRLMGQVDDSKRSHDELSQRLFAAENKNSDEVVDTRELTVCVCVCDCMRDCMPSMCRCWKPRKQPVKSSAPRMKKSVY